MEYRVNDISVLFGEQGNKNLRLQTAKGGFTLLAAKPLSLSIQVASTAIIARLLYPEAFGLVAMIHVIIQFVTVFSDFGLSGAALQDRLLTREMSSNLFWINIGLGLLVGFIIAALAYPISIFYREPRLIELTLLSAVSLPLGVWTRQHLTLLRRALKYKIIALHSVYTGLFGSVATILCIKSGLDYKSLVYGGMLGTLMSNGILIAQVPWLPGKFTRGIGTRKKFSFGAHLLIQEVFLNLNNRFDKIMVGRYFDVSTLGHYNKAFELSKIAPNQLLPVVQTVFSPAFYRIGHDEIRLRRAYRDAIELLAIISIPLTLSMAALAEPLITLYLGEQWRPAAYFFFWFCIRNLLWLTNSPGNWVLTAVGKPKEGAKMHAWLSIISIATVIALVPYGIDVLVMGVAIQTLLSVGIRIVYITKNTPITVTDYLLGIFPALALGCGIFGITKSIPYCLPHSSNIMFILLGGIAFILSYATLLFTPYGKEILNTIRSFRSQGVVKHR